MFVAVLDGQLSLAAPDAANPYTTRILLESTPDPRIFVMRQQVRSPSTLSVNS